MATINRFTLVQLASGALDSKPTVNQWNPSAYEEPALTTGHIILGVAMTDSDYEQPVAVMKRGFMREVTPQNSESWSVGDILYGKSDGSITKTRPAGPLPQVIVGTVFESGLDPTESFTICTIDVDVRVLPSIAELSGVTRETLANLDVLIYNGTTHAWVPRQIDHGGDIAGLLDDDHTQYLKEKASGGTAAETPEHTHQSAATCGTLDHGLVNTAASLLDNDHPLYQRKHGFEVSSVGAALQTITYDKTTRKITITPTGATFRFWIDGVQFIKTGAQVLGTAHGTTTGKYFIYYDSSGVMQVSAVETPWGIRDRTVIPVSVVYWNNDISDGVCFYECHTADRTLEQHYRDHFSQGAQFISGYDLTGYTPSTDSDAAVTYAVAAGIMADEDIKFDSTAIADGGSYSIFWREGAAGPWRWTATDTFPFKYGTTYPSYNQWTGATWQLTEVTGGGTIQYLNYYICATSAVSPVAASAFHVPGQSVYTSLADAQAESLQSLSLGTIPFEEVAPLYRITYAIRNSYAGTHKCQIVQVTSLKNQTVTVAGGTVGITAHSALTGLTAADVHPASSITFTPYSTLAATDVQAAIQELLDEAAAPSLALDDLSDVNAPSPSNGDLLAWDSTPGEWVNISPPAGTLSGLSDVDITGLGTGDGLYWNATSGFWEPAGAPPPGAHASTHEALGSDPIALDTLAAPTNNTDLDATTSAHGLCPKGSGVAGEFLKSDLSWGAPATVAALDDLSDVNAPSPGVGEVLTWSGTEWAPDTASASVASLDNVGDCNVPTPSNGDVLTWDSTPGEWVAAAPAAAPSALDDLSDVTAPSPSDNDVLTWDTGTSKWVNQAPSGGSLTLSQRLVLLNLSPGTQTYPIFLAPVACTVIKVRAVQIGSGTCTVNATANAVEVGSDVTPGASPTWAASATVSVAVTAGQALAVVVKSVVGTISYLVVQVDYTQGS